MTHIVRAAYTRKAQAIPLISVGFIGDPRKA
jgi:hypothetical protein